MNIVWIPQRQFNSEPIVDVKLEGGIVHAEHANTEMQGGGNTGSSAFKDFQKKQYFVFEKGTPKPRTPVLDLISPMHAAMKFYSNMFRGKKDAPAKTIIVQNAKTGFERIYSVAYKFRTHDVRGGKRIDRQVHAKWLKMTLEDSHSLLSKL